MYRIIRRSIPIMMLMLAFCYCTTIFSQVTIGSGIEPVHGALLDLKEDQRNDGTANSTKGMMLPRVRLTDLNRLYPMFAAGYDVAENAKHVGLVVYSIFEDACASTPITKGVYVWDGSLWNFLNGNSGGNGSLGAGIEIFTDTRDGRNDEYLTGDFGSAGRWFLENLRYLPTDGSIVLSSNADATAPPDNKTYFYPEGLPENIYPNYPSTWEPRQGLLYNWNAATAGKNEIPAYQFLDQRQDNTVPGIPGANEVETLYQTTPGAKNGKIQGLCPAGWHVPSDRDWNLLEKEIYEHAEKYSSYTLAEREAFNTSRPWQDVWETEDPTTDTRPNWYPPDGQGKAMRSLCPVIAGGNSTNGLSLPVTRGGFNALLTGSCNWDSRGGPVQFNSHFQVWSSSRYNSSSVWFRETQAYGSTTGGGVVRNVVSSSLWLFSIRCKKDI
ncbi:FISUMP domain-containing protein [Dysgonomonas sp.]